MNYKYFTLACLLIITGEHWYKPLQASPITPVYREELTKLATLLAYTPKNIRQKTLKTIEALLTPEHSTEEIKQRLMQLIETTQYRIQASHIPRDQLRMLPPYMDPQYNPYNPHNHLQIIWQLLLYCGIGCCVYLAICALQDNHASSILSNKSKKSDLATIQSRQQALEKAARTTHALSEALAQRRRS